MIVYKDDSGKTMNTIVKEVRDKIRRRQRKEIIKRILMIKGKGNYWIYNSAMRATLRKRMIRKIYETNNK